MYDIIKNWFIDTIVSSSFLCPREGLHFLQRRERRQSAARAHVRMGGVSSYAVLIARMTKRDSECEIRVVLHRVNDPP